MKVAMDKKLSWRKVLMKKKVLGILIIFIVLLSFSPRVYAETIPVSTAAKLREIATNVENGTKDYHGDIINITANINLGNTAFTPIGTSSNPFAGTVNGNNKTISGLLVSGSQSNSTGDYQGLFGKISATASISNLTVSGSVTGRNNVGGIVGGSLGNITNCTSSCTVKGRNYVGGIVGSGENITIKNCSNTGTISGENYVGGIEGSHRGPVEVKNVYNTGSVTGNSSSGAVGGIIGYVQTVSGSAGSLSYAYNAGRVTNSSGTAYAVAPTSASDFTTSRLYCLAGVVSSVEAGVTTRSQTQLRQDSMITNLNSGQATTAWEKASSNSVNNGYPILSNGSSSLSGTYTVQYYNGKNNLGSSTHTIGMAQPLSTFSGLGGTAPNTWTFEGWGAINSTSATSPTYEDGESVINLSTTNGGTVALYAIFKRNIKFISGANQSKSGDVVQRYNPYATSQVTTVTAPVLQNISDWTALGYRTNTDASTAAVAASTTETGSVKPLYNATSLTYYGVYSRELTITYAGNGNSGGSTTSTTQTVYMNTNSTTTSSQQVSLANNGFSRTGYTFLDWKIDGAHYDANGVYNPRLAYNETLFEKTAVAQWLGSVIAVVDNDSSGTFTLTSGKIRVSGSNASSQAVLNTGTTKIVSGNVEGGNIGIHNQSNKVIIGTSGDSSVSQSSPRIKGETYGISGDFQFYDGIILGKPNALLQEPTIVENGYYVVYGSSSPYETATLDLLPATAPTVTAYNHAYDGEPHGVGVSNTTEGTIVYSSNGTSGWSATPITLTNVGSTTVYVKVSGDSSHGDSEVRSATITITRAIPTITISPASASVNYHASKTFTATVKAAPGVSGTLTAVSASSSYVAVAGGASTNLTAAQTGATNGIGTTITYSGESYRASTTKIRVTFTPSGANASNYETVSGDFHVTAVNRIANPTTVTAVSGLTYGDTGALVTVGNQQGTPYFAVGTELSASNFDTTGSTSIPTAGGLNAGTHKVYYYIAEGGNYRLKSGEVSVTIGKKTATAPTVTEYNDEYDGNAHSVSVSNTTEGTIVYSEDAGANKTWTTSSIQKTAVGNYTVYVKVSGDSNHFDSSVVTSSITINPIGSSSLTVTVEPRSLVYNKTAQTPTITVKSGNTLLHENDDYDLDVTNNTNVGRATITITAKGSYSGTVIEYFDITEKDIGSPDLLGDLSEDTFSYNGSEKTPTVIITYGTTILSLGTDYDVDYSNNTNAGTGHAIATGKGNYTGTRDIPFTIEKIDATLPTLSDYSGTYDGGEHTISVETDQVGGTVVYSTDEGENKTWDTTKPTRTNAGETIVYVKVSGDSNHNDSEMASKKITLSRKRFNTSEDITISVAPAEQDYTGSAIYPTSVVVKENNVPLVSGEDFTMSYTNNINAGVATATATGIGNYTGTKSATYHINAIDASLSIIPNTLTVDKRETKTAEIVYTSDGTTIQVYSNDENVATVSREGNTLRVTGVKAGTTTITVSISEGNNYHAISENLTVTTKDIDAPETLTTSVSYIGDNASVTVYAQDSDTGIERITVNGTEITITKNAEEGSATGGFTISTKGDYEIIAYDGEGNHTSKTLHAYAISYLANSNEEVSGTMTSHIKINGVTATIKSNAFNKVGNTFVEWNTNQAGTSAGGTSFAEGDPYIGNADLTLYAQWSKNTYTVTFYNDDGVNGEQLVDSHQYQYGEKIAVPENQQKFGVDITEGGEITGYIVYTQDAWVGTKLNPNAAHDPVTITSANQDSIYMIDSNVTYRARYASQTYSLEEGTVYIDGNAEVSGVDIGLQNNQGIVIVGRGASSTATNNPTIKGAVSLENNSGVILWYQGTIQGPMRPYAEVRTMK